MFIIAYSVGAILVKINTSQADFIKKDFETKIKGINQYGIFANNFKVALGMFIPGFGIALGGFSAFSTGLVFNAIAQTSPALSNISPLIVFLTPFGILEIIAYGIAISRSGILSYQLIKDTKKRNSWRKYIIPTVVEIGIVVIILFIGSIVEWQMILEHEPRKIAINPDKFDKLITSLRTAVDNDGTLDKEATSYNDIFDAFRLALKFYHFREKDDY